MWFVREGQIVKTSQGKVGKVVLVKVCGVCHIELNEPEGKIVVRADKRDLEPCYGQS